MTAATTWLRLVAVSVLGAAAGMIAFTGPAVAKACPAGTGVTVVVNSSVGCDKNGEGTAASNFTDAGHTLRYAAKEPGFVCRVNGSPSSDPCGKASPANAYWGLFWSDGKSGKWLYASSGVGSVRVPQGGWVAFVFQSGNTRKPPSMRPVTQPAKQGKATTSGGSSSSTSSGGSVSGASSPTPRPSKAPERDARPADEQDESEAASSPSPSASASPSVETRDVSTDVEQASQEEPSRGAAVPWWAAVGLGALLAGAAALVSLRRRSRRAG